MNPSEKVSNNSGASLRVAATCGGTTALGPGLRAIVWVQGCPFHCAGCIAPEWVPFDRPVMECQPEELAAQLLANPQVTGLTFSGGEPFAQAGALARLAREARRRRSLDVICFTGYRFETLLNHPPEAGTFDLLDEVDVLIDGPFIASQNNGVGLRGSTNQRIHYLTRRLITFDFEYRPRRMEVIVRNGELLVIGIPTTSNLQTLDRLTADVFKSQMAAGGINERS